MQSPRTKYLSETVLWPSQLLKYGGQVYLQLLPWWSLLQLHLFPPQARMLLLSKLLRKADLLWTKFAIIFCLNTFNTLFQQLFTLFQQLFNKAIVGWVPVSQQETFCALLHIGISGSRLPGGLFIYWDPGSLAPSHRSNLLLLGEVEPREPDLSEDEGLSPEEPAFTGLFPQALFKTLLFKAVNAAQLGSCSTELVPPPSHWSRNPLFVEPTKPLDSIPAPPLFLGVVRKQWSLSGSAPVLFSANRKYFSVAPDLATFLQVPTVDAPVTALLPNAAIPGDPDEGPEEHCSDQVLQQAHQGPAWAIRVATTASFFNRTTLLWLHQLQGKLSPEDTRLQQDLNKIIAAVQFSADATLNSVRFAAKSLASLVAPRRLVWLQHWQADARHK